MKEPPGSPCTWTWTAEAHSPSRSPQHQHWYPYGKVTGRNSVPFCSALDPSPLQAANLTRQQVRLQEGAFVSYRMESPTVTTGHFLVLSHGSGLTSSDTCCSPLHMLPGHWTYSVQIRSWRRTYLPFCYLKSQASSLHNHGSLHLLPWWVQVPVCNQKSRLLFLRWLCPIWIQPNCFSSPLIFCVPPSFHSSLTWWHTSSMSTHLL